MKDKLISICHFQLQKEITRCKKPFIMQELGGGGTERLVA